MLRGVSLRDVCASTESAILTLNAFLTEAFGGGHENTMDALMLVRLSSQLADKSMKLYGMTPVKAPRKKRKSAPRQKDTRCPGPFWRDDAFVDRIRKKRGRNWTITRKCKRPKSRGGRYRCYRKGVYLCDSCGQMYSRDKNAGLVMIPEK